jgi:predicted RNA binding protein YcfA (HicA-like mRNA interferase family)
LCSQLNKAYLSQALKQPPETSDMAKATRKYRAAFSFSPRIRGEVNCMTGKLPAVKPKRVIKALGRVGFNIHHVKGGHYFLRKGNTNIIIPYHNKDLKPGTLHDIIKQSGLTIEEFLSLL